MTDAQKHSSRQARQDEQPAIFIRGPFHDPALTRIRCILLYTRTPFTHKRSIGLWGDSSVAVAGETVSDTSTVTQPALRLLDLTLDESWESRITEDLDIALGLKCSALDWYRLVKKTDQLDSRLLGLQSLVYRYARAYAGRKKVSALGSDRDQTNLGFIARQFKLAMTGPFYAGDRPGHVDLSFFGMLAGFIYADCPIGKFVLDAASLDDWAKRMNDEIPIRNILSETESSGSAIVGTKI